MRMSILMKIKVRPLTFNIPTANQYVRNLQILQFIVKNTSVIRLFFQKCFPPTRLRMIRFSFRGVSTIWLHFITQKIGQWSDVFFKLCYDPNIFYMRGKFIISEEMVNSWYMSSVILVIIRMSEVNIKQVYS